jgi:hypothetical protein
VKAKVTSGMGKSDYFRINANLINMIIENTVNVCWVERVKQNAIRINELEKEEKETTKSMRALEDNLLKFT